MVDLWECEQLVICRDDAVGLRAVIAIDDTTFGAGLGGVRMRPYASTDHAVFECQRLAQAMTLKNTLAELPYGGAKSVILQPEHIVDRQALLGRFGEFVARTGGAYLPGVDMGTSVTDLGVIAEGGAEVSCAVEDPSPWTALGVAAGITAAIEHVDRRSGIDGVRVVIQGAGHVGAALARELAAGGAQITVADIDEDAAAELAAEVAGRTVSADAALQEACDVFAPCAIARVISADSVGRLGCRIVAGAANDTLSARSDAELLARRGITYIPDFIANAGGVIQIHAERAGFTTSRLRADVEQIGDRVRELLSDAERSHSLPLAVAESTAAGRLARTRQRVHVEVAV
jgi:leucine dehydrogenase